MFSTNDYWSFEGGFGSIGVPGWGSSERWQEVISGALNPFRQSGSYSVIGEIPTDLEVLQREQRVLEEQIANSPIGTGSLPPINEEVWAERIRTPVEQLDKEIEDDDMAIDWGAFISGGIDLLQGQNVGGGGGSQYQGAGSTTGILFPSTAVNQVATAQALGTGCDGMAWSGGTPPKGYKVVNSCGVGVLRKVRRRRRRRMLTQGDKSDIASIVSMVGKGQLASALINRSTS